MKIYAPVKETNGVYASVRFVDGVGETDNPRLIEWFRNQGYTIEKCENSPSNPPEKCSNLVIEPQNDVIEVVDDEIEMMGYYEREPDFDKMTPLQIREWALANGYNVRNTRSREKLLEIIRG